MAGEVSRLIGTLNGLPLERWDCSAFPMFTIFKMVLGDTSVIISIGGDIILVRFYDSKNNDCSFCSCCMLGCCYNDLTGPLAEQIRLLLEKLTEHYSDEIKQQQTKHITLQHKGKPHPETIINEVLAAAEAALAEITN